MCILLYVKLIWCSGIPEMYGQMEEGGHGTCAFCSMCNFFGVVIFYTSIVDCRGAHLPYIYVHSAICQTFAV